MLAFAPPDDFAPRCPQIISRNKHADRYFLLMSKLSNSDLINGFDDSASLGFSKSYMEKLRYLPNFQT